MYKILLLMRFFAGITCLLAVFLSSCGGSKTVQIWTDRPEFAIYGEYFNNIQNQYKVTVRYYEFLSAELDDLARGNSGNTAVQRQFPDIVAGSGLKNASTRTHFKSLDNFFGARKLSRSIFYSRLLATGRIDSNQYLLPVSFNIPALVFSREREQELSSELTIGFDEIKNLSKGYNAVSGGSYTRMGFSPLWSDDFLFFSAVLFGSSFRDGSPLAWDASALTRSMDFVYNWTNEINTNNQAEENFTFKYFIEPPEKLVQSGRILFSYIDSSDLFSLNEDGKSILDYRWLMEQNQIPITEGAVFLGIPKKGKSRAAARAFINWFFQVENQRQLMEYCKANGLNENVFGICGGFSSLGQVTEQVFPRYYPDLLGHLPPSDFFMTTNILPGNWSVLKERVILPYLHERARKEKADDVLSLERRLSDWVRANR